MKKIIYLSISAVFMVIAFIAVFIGLNYLLKPSTAEVPEMVQMQAAQAGPEIYDGSSEFILYAPVHESETEAKLETEEVREKISSDTRIVYEYYYEADKKTVTSEEEPKYFLLGMTEEELAEIHRGWEIVTFSDDEVVLRKNIEAPTGQTYVVSVLDGYIAVFYQGEGVSGVKEVTSTPIASLSKEEQSRLISGISVKGEPDLMKLLEDYGS